MQHPEGAAIRRHVDTRLVSYAIVLSKDEQIRPAMVEATRVCTTAILLAAGGMEGLIRACRGASSSDHLKRFEATQRRYFQALFGSIADSLEESWKAEIRQLMELVLLTGANITPDDEEAHYWLTMAQTVGMDTRPFAMHEDDVKVSQNERMVEDDEPVQPRRKRKRSRSSKEIYQKERFDNLVARCISLGIGTIRAMISNGHVYIVGVGAKGTEKLVKLRGDMAEAHKLCESVNKEIKSFGAGEPKFCDNLRA